MYCAKFSSYAIDPTNKFTAQGTYYAGPCTGYDSVVLTIEEYARTAPNADIWHLDTVAGGQIAGAILAVWALGFGFRAIIRALNIDSLKNESDS